MNTVKPSKEAMLVCDEIITEANTNKKSLIGIFEQISTATLPTSHPSLGVYIKFTGALGKYQFRLELVDLQTDKAIGSGTLEPQQITEKLGSHELVFRLRNLKFQTEGKYEFRIFANDELFGIKTFEVTKRPANE